MARHRTNSFHWPWLSHLPPLGLSYSAWAATSAMVEIEVKPTSLTGYTGGHSEILPARELLLCAGLMTSPGTAPCDLASWGFLVEHSFSLRPTSGVLRVVDSARWWDSRTKTLFSERLAAGLTGWLLWKRFGIDHIADADFFIGRTLNDPASPFHKTGLKSKGLYGKSGKYKPDYFCLNDKSEAVIAESKGAIGPPSAVSADERKKAKEQVKNVAPVGIPLTSVNNRLTFALTQRYETDRPVSGKDTQMEVADPEPNENAVEVRVSADECAVHSYAKFFALLGHFQLRRLLHSFEPQEMWPLLENFVVEHQKESHDLNYVPLGAFGEVEIGLLNHVFVSMFSQPAKGLARRLEMDLFPYQDRARLSLGESRPYTLLPNGVVAIYEI